MYRVAIHTALYQQPDQQIQAMSSMPAGGEDKGSASSARADTPENAFAAEPTLADERDYSTDDDDDDDDEDASDSDDDDMPLGPLGRLVDSECDRFRQQYIGSQGSTTERGARLLWQTWEDATMLLRSECDHHLRVPLKPFGAT